MAAPAAPMTRRICGASRRTVTLTAMAIVMAASHSGQRAGSREVMRMTVAMAEGPAMAGMASGTM